MPSGIVAEPRPVTEGRNAARAVRADNQLGTAPIADLFSFIERLHAGTLVIRKPMPDGPEGALVRSGDDLLLIINTAERLLSRQRFTAAHELGHQHFDSGTNATFIERDLFRNDVLEMRANAFAVNLLLPLQAIKERRDDGRIDINNDEHLVVLSLEYGLSLQSLGYHLKNNSLITDKRRLELTTLRPLKMASSLGFVERAREEFQAKGTTRWPGRFVQLAVEAHDANSLPDSAKAMLRQDESAQTWLDREAEFDLFTEA